MRQFGQTKLPLSFISNPSAVNQDPKSKPSKQSISLSEFLDRKLGKSSGRLLQEKQISIGSLGSAKKDFKGDPSEAVSSSVPEGAIFQQFSRALKGKHGADLGDRAEVVKQYSMKRKKPSEFSSGSPQVTVLAIQSTWLFLETTQSRSERGRSESQQITAGKQYIIIMPVAKAGGTATRKELTAKKWATVKKRGRVWEALHLEVWSGTEDNGKPKLVHQPLQRS
ncbi:hypothetical protein KSP39_PZI021201 [Platanthera zijinensis]|uniref:Uncharacterized protein n=1 Tax=Platanthera zijinensis TaxID=2320716 RepID=A0AAP0FVK7_9ASPA